MGEVLVAGGGISGMYAALLLARRGRRVRLLERSDRLGGLAGTELFRGLPCDLGSHRLHPSALEHPLFRELDARDALLSRPRRGQLLLGKARVPYPPGPLAMLRALGLPASLSLFAGLLVRRSQRRAFARWSPSDGGSDGANDDVGFERFVTDRVGARAYDVFYRPYAEKVWGLDPAELSQSVAKKRWGASAPWRVVLGRNGDRFLYPRGGIGSIASHLQRELARHGVPIELGARFAPERAEGRTVLYAGDLADLVPTPLEHRGLYVVWMALPMARVGRFETYYSPDPRHWFGRVAEIQNYSPDLATPGETVLAVEIPEGRWGDGGDFTTPDRLAELCEQLEDAGIVPRGVRPIEVRQRFVRGVYPLYRRGWRATWRATMDRVVALGRVFPFARPSLFLHVNLDHCATIATDVVEHVESGGDVASWITRAERYLDLRVRD